MLLASMTMPKPFLFCLLVAGCLPLLAGCWGESKGSMSRRMKEQKELMEANDSKSGVVDPDSGIAVLPKAAAAGTKAGGTPPDADSGIAPPKPAAVGIPATSKPSPV